MNKFSVNDWLTIQTRKDLTFIRRSIEHETVNNAIFADMFIAFFSFVMDHVLWSVVDPNTGAVEQVAPSWYWICTAFLLVAVPIAIFAWGIYKKERFQADVKKVMPVEYLVDLFDNEICYNAMTADSMRDHMMNESETFEDEIRKFYFIEAAYYANKAVSQLFYFKNQGKKAIQTKNSLGGISFVRFHNVCEIVSNIYEDLISYTKEHEIYKPLLEDSKDFIFNFNDLLKHMGGIIPEIKNSMDALIIAGSQDSTSN